MGSCSPLVLLELQEPLDSLELLEPLASQSLLLPLMSTAHNNSSDYHCY